MTNEEMRIAIAEVCGWKRCETHWVAPCGYGRMDNQPPNYPEDLNAMHKAESSLTPRLCSGCRDIDEVRDFYTRMLQQVCWKDFHQTFIIAHATAQQRAEAFLRTIGKWK